MTSTRAITGATTVVGVIGDPVRHSLSPAIHNAAYEAIGLDAVYVAFPVATGSGDLAVASCRALGLRGLSVTMPHKEAVLKAADECSEDAHLLGAANTLINNNGRIRAESTDGIGCVNALHEAGFDPVGKKCMVIGAGGAGRGVVLALCRAGARVVVVNRSRQRGEHAVALGGANASLGVLDAVSDMDLVINATSQGMGNDASLPLDPTRLRKGQFVNDLIYNPMETPLLRAALQAGAIPVDGLGMLIHQAAQQILLWTGDVAPISVMRDAANAELDRRAAVLPTNPEG